MQQLQGIHQHPPQRIERRRLRAVGLTVQTGLHHLDVPVAEFLPYEIIDLLDSDTQIKGLHQGGDVLRQIIHFG